jgi:signal transduction histidine kinase
MSDELARAKADEQQVRALFADAAAFFIAGDIAEVSAELARSAVAHLGLADASVHRLDHDQGLIVGVTRAVATPDGALRLEDLDQEIDARSDNALAAFASGRLNPADRFAAFPSPTAAESVLVKMSPAIGPYGTGLVVGIVSVSARPGETLDARAIELLCSLVGLAAGATEQARMEALRGQLVSSVTHELRTPLASIRAYNEMLLDGDAGAINDEQQLFLQRVELMSLRLERLVDDLLDLSRLRAGELAIRKAPADVGAIVDHTINALQPEAVHANIRLVSVIEPDLPLIYTDADRLSQVLFNLAGNAVKYVGEGGDVRLRAEIEGGADATSSRLVISVEDNGPGIVPEDLEKIFDEFQRGRGAEGTTKGSGLGLAIASRLTRLLGGEIGVESVLGEGSVFSLRFPMRALTVKEET